MSNILNSDTLTTELHTAIADLRQVDPLVGLLRFVTIGTIAIGLMALVVGGLNKPTILNSTSDDDNQIAILWLFAPPTTSLVSQKSVCIHGNYGNRRHLLCVLDYL